ncbi:MAG TPA: PH domain-containing protein [Planctomycetota bacterium]|jgi:uncharacterized membrane protein YdbT with pleckstrin-like domain|nr:PH domain-containing protein [Planctomycetota bacterium]
MKASDLRPGEKVLFVARHHGLALFWPILLSLLVVGIPWLIYRILVLKTDIWIITDRRLVDEVGILSKTVKESPFEKINNASYRQTFLGRVFGYGDVEIETASKDGASTLTFVRKPAEVCRILMEAVDADIENKPPPAVRG